MMTAFLEDMLEDLREKRLWPVALLLVLAVVAAPVLLTKRGEGAARVPSATPSAAPPQVSPPLDMTRVKPLRKNHLLALAAKDPFAGPAAKLKTLPALASEDPFARPAPGTESATAPTSPSARTSPAGTGSSASSSGSTAPSSGSTGSPVGKDVTTTPTTEDDGRKANPKKVTYTFRIDATFGRAGHARARKRLPRFAMLPDRDGPLLLFLGVDARATKAKFLVDASLSQSGEGECGDKACSLVKLGVGNVHTFTDGQGRDFVLRLDQIRKVRGGTRASRRSWPMASLFGDLIGKAPAKAPVITYVSPTRVSVCGTLKLRGRNFSGRRLRNILIFRARGGEATFVKPRRSSTRRLIVRLPGKLRRLLRAADDGAMRPTRLQIRPLVPAATGKWTAARTSPVVVPVGGGSAGPVC